MNTLMQHASHVKYRQGMTLWKINVDKKLKRVSYQVYRPQTGIAVTTNKLLAATTLEQRRSREEEITEHVRTDKRRQDKGSKKINKENRKKS